MKKYENDKNVTKQKEKKSFPKMFLIIVQSPEF